MKFILLVACVLCVAVFIPQQMISAIYAPDQAAQASPDGAPAEGADTVNAQTRTLGGSAQGLNKQDIPQPTGRNADAAQVPCGAKLQEPVAVARAAPANPAPAAPAVPAVNPIADDDDDDDDD